MPKPKSKWKRLSACDVVKGRPGPRLNADLVKNELEAFLLYINENLITKIVERNDQMRKVRKKINAEELLFRYSDKSEEEIKCLFGLLSLEACTTTPNSQQKSPGVTHFLQGKYIGQQCY